MIGLKLARAGYGGGDPEEILGMKADMVLAMLQWEQFNSDYEKKYYELNKEKA
jgi:hypothetical protein